MTSFNLALLPDAGQPVAGDKFLVSRGDAYHSIDGSMIIGSAVLGTFAENFVGCLRELNAVVTELKGQAHGLDIAASLAVSRSATALEQAQSAVATGGEALKLAGAAQERGDSAFSYAGAAFNQARAAQTLAERALAQTSDHAAIPSVRTRTNDPAIPNPVSLQVPPNWNVFAPGTGAATKLGGLIGLVVPFYCNIRTEITGLSFIQSSQGGGLGTARQAIYAWNATDSTLRSEVYGGVPVQYAAKRADLYADRTRCVLPPGWYAYVIAATSRLDLSAQPTGTSLHRDMAVYSAGSNATAALYATSFTFAATKAQILSGFSLDAATALSISEKPGLSSPLISWEHMPDMG